MAIHQPYFGYIRVSTAKQGEQGVSLQEQQDGIRRYAERQGIEVVRWFEERETAAKRGRPVFAEVLKLLRSGKAQGVIVHKIDRSARNLWDWAQLGALLDQGIEVKFANEDLDLKTRGGRLSADIQAVVAADYVRNLREEAKKGFYGRLKQGIYPLPAPLGYVDQGPGKPKIADPVRAPLVRELFGRYASGEVTLRTLREDMHRLGLRTRRGGKVSINVLSTILRNPFYIGLIRIRRTGETFHGAHDPLVSKALFDRVQERLDGKVRTRGWRHDFLFRRLLRCKGCGYSLIGERQKGHIYYRCHTLDCPTTAVREEAVETTFQDALGLLQFTPTEHAYLKSRLERLRTDWAQESAKALDGINLRIAALNSRLQRLTDAYLDRLLGQEDFMRRKDGYLQDLKGAEERRAELQSETASVPATVAEFLELATATPLLYTTADPSQKRLLLEIATSNRVVHRKNIELPLAPPFSIIAERQRTLNGPPTRNRT